MLTKDLTKEQGLLKQRLLIILKDTRSKIFLTVNIQSFVVIPWVNRSIFINFLYPY